VTEFAEELEIFRTEEEEAQQAFFAYLSVRSLAATDQDVLTNMNNTPLFWLTAHHAMLVAAFLALGRIFDQDPKSDHNINKLMRVTGDSLHLFTKAALLNRKIADGLSLDDAKEYVSDAYELTSHDVREMRRLVADWRKIYEERYRDVRHMVFAHKRRQEIVQAVLAKTNIDQLKDLFGFLAGLYEALIELHLNGRQPIVNVRQFTLPPKAGRSSMSPGERVYLEGYEVLKMVTLPDAAELRYNSGDLS
jgi:hypothetical protein